jgi:UDP-N-acetyl-D-galactosamine dehydrogenase
VNQHISKNLSNSKLAIIGLGYVGLPLAVEFGKIRPVIGFDICENRINQLKESVDKTLECSSDDLLSAVYLSFTSNPKDLVKAQIFIITVPTPVDQVNRPDMSALLKASKTVGEFLKKGDIVIFESTVYPGATEEICVPVLENEPPYAFARKEIDF